MVQNFDSHELAGGGQLAGKLFIFEAGHKIAARVVVHTDDCRREFLLGGMDDFAAASLMSMMRLLLLR